MSTKWFDPRDLLFKSPFGAVPCGAVALAAETRKQLREARKETRKARREARKDK